MNTHTVLTLVLSCSLLFLSACGDSINRITPSGTITTEAKSFTDFDELALSGAFQAFIHFSSTEEKVEIEANENVHEVIEVKKNGNELSIGLKGNNSFSGTVTLKAHITTNELVKYDLSGASKVTLMDDSSANSIDIDLSGASNFSGHLTSNQLDIDLSGASIMNLSGTTNRTNMDLSGASQFRDYDFTTDVLDADLSGASTAKITVNNEINLEASGASMLQYKGDPVVNSELSGASSIQKMD